MQDIIIRIRERLQAEIEKYSVERCCGSQAMQPEDSRNREYGLRSALAIVDEECFRRDVGAEVKELAVDNMRAFMGDWS